MRGRTLLLAGLLSGVSLSALAQPAPFDMSPEGSLVVQQPEPMPEQPVAAPQPAVPVVQNFERYFLPDPVLRLDGEQSRQTMVVYLTQAQAAAPARVELAYLNAVMVAPEVSDLTIAINGTNISATQIAASTAPGAVSVDLPAGLLHAGANIFSFAASQRHRTDCSVQSTYELWTQVESGGARLIFGDPAVGQIQQLADLAAVGVDGNGRTTVRLLAPAMTAPEAGSAAMMLAQRLALALRVADVTYQWADAPATAYAPGQLDVVFAPADQLPVAFASIADQARSGAIAALMPQASGATTLVITGPDWQSVSAATTALIDARPLGPENPRNDLPAAHPLMPGGSGISLAELGVGSTEFSGRLFTTRFSFDLPSDFYADRYGEAELVLDAAYSSDVQPGSEIDIYTNSQIASATPLLRTDGGQLRDTVIRIPMRNLRAGRNIVDVNVALNTSSDAVCSPGWTGQAPVRFVMSNSTQLRLPDYARIAALPDLRVFTGSAWPYSEQASVPVVVGEGAAVFASAMTLMGRLAASSNVVLPVGVIAEAELAPQTSAIIIKPSPALSGPTRERVLVGVGGGVADDSAMLNQFAGGSNQNGFGNLAETVLRPFGLEPDDLRLIPPPDEPYRPANPNAAMFTQVVQPEGGVWTTYTAATPQGMEDGLSQFLLPHYWRQIAGRVSSVSLDDADVKVVEPNNKKLIETQPFSLTNLRLVAANWFSTNLPGFTGVIILASILLMLTSSLVLKRLGRE